MPGIDNKDVRISTVLGYKGHDDFSSHPQKTKLYQQALLNLQQGVENGDIKSGDIPEEFRKEGLKRKSPEPKKEPTAEPEKEPSAKILMMSLQTFRISWLLSLCLTKMMPPMILMD